MKTPRWAVKCKAAVDTKDGPKRCGTLLVLGDIPEPSEPHVLGPRTFDLTCEACHQRRTYTEEELFSYSPSDPVR
jgi:hypothetical protein